MSPDVTRINAAAIDRGEVIGLNPGKPYPAKAWPEKRFVRLAEQFAGDGRQVVVLWGPGEREVARRIADQAPEAVRLASELPLDALPGILKNLGVVVTIDSGLKHLAVAVDVPTVTLFGPTSPYEWHMGTDNDRILYAGLPCSPCRKMECPIGTPCMGQITTDAVRRAVLEIEHGASP